MHLPLKFQLHGRYRIERMLGQGGFGITYKVHDVVLDQAYCMKELFISGNSTRSENQTVNSHSLNGISFSEFRQKFIDEARELARFNHKNIVRVLNIFEANNTAYYIMEYVEGETLKALIERRGALSRDEAIPIMQQLLDAVEEVHSKGKLHRDIKPENVLREESGRIVLIDFGSTRDFSEGRTMTQTAMVTPGYAPLEQYSERAARTRATDIYSLGATMYYLLTGCKPLAATERVHEELKAPHLLQKGLDSQLSSAVMLAMQMKPENRFQDVKSFRAALIELSVSAEKSNERVKVPAIEHSEEVEFESEEQSRNGWIWFGFALGIAVVAYLVYLAFYKSGGWIEENKISMRETCFSLMTLSYDEADATTICDCYIQSLVQKYPKADFNPEQNQAEMDACSANYMTSEEKQAFAESEAELRQEEGAWDEETYNSLVETCISLMTLSYDESDADEICLCYIDNLSSKYPQADFTPEQNQAEMDACSTSYKTASEKQAEAMSAAMYSQDAYGIEPEMVWVEGGRFMMGSNSGDSDERPVHEVELSSFYIGKYEVTQAQWKAVMGTNPSHFSGCDQCPVENVSWNDIQEFIRKLNQLTGKSYRLPTEAEWEHAARGGNKSRGSTYSGGNDVGSVGWYDGNSGSRTYPVGQKTPNELGVYDMTGNVWEWCADWHGSYTSSRQRNPVGPFSGEGRVLRGGGWYYNPKFCRVSNRSEVTPDSRLSSGGFRLTLSSIQ
jgi:formylglycine-generating enzyme required for sulfatase activity/serine/threonine protein kinase